MASTSTDPMRRYRPEVSLIPGHIQPFVTVVVLISGVVGGLILVISIILICKYCVKQKKTLKRQPAAYVASSDHGPFTTKYETNEPSEIQNLYSVDVEKDIENGNIEAEKNLEDEEENIDYYVQKYQEMLKDGNGNPDARGDEWEMEMAAQTSSSSRSAPTPRSSVVSAPVFGPPSPQGDPEVERESTSAPAPVQQARRVSFQDEQHLKRRALCVHGAPLRPPPLTRMRGRSYDMSDPIAVTRNWSFRRDSKKKASVRYTDGDYHYLKRMRIQRPPSCANYPLVRQYSVGGLPSATNIKSQERYIRSMTDDPTYHKALYGAHQDSSLAVYMVQDLHREPSPKPSPVIQKKPMKTEVHALVHRSSTSISSLDTKTSPPVKPRHESKRRSPRISPPRDLALFAASSRHSFSVETVSPIEVAVLGRRVKSYEGSFRENNYDNRNLIDFSKGPFYNADFDVVSEGAGSPNFRSKVRYNDTGSLEEIGGDAANAMLNEVLSDLPMEENSDDAETLNGGQKYRDIWSLRATLEEEDLSDTIRLDELSSPEASPDHDKALSTYTTSFESNTEGGLYTDCTDSDVGTRYRLHPLENRRQDYKSILSRRLRRIDGHRPSVGETSFDSIETMDTDGDVSDTSRPVDTTTSFESTTDNTDSTGDSQTHKLQQMKYDSGYRSLESTQMPKLSKKQIHFALDQESLECDESEEVQSDKSPVELRIVESQVKRGRGARGGHFERRSGRTASKKRREFSRERQLVQVNESINEPETDSRSDLPSGDSFDDSAVPNKFSVFSRFFKSHHKERIRLARDYSIDEKTNRIFNEFLKPLPGSERNRSPRSRGRLQRKFTDPSSEFTEFQRNKLVPEMRSTSLGSDSSCASSRRLSPQDSVDEEPFPSDSLMKSNWESKVTHAQTVVDPSPKQHDIPIICLPEEEVTEV